MITNEIGRQSSAVSQLGEPAQRWNRQTARTGVALLSICFTALSFICSPLAGAQEARNDASRRPLVPQGDPVEVVAGLVLPWSAVLIGDELLISQRGSAEISAFRPGETLRTVGRVADFEARGDGGMLGLALLSQGTSNWLYAYHSTPGGNRIVRLPYRDGSLGEEEIILDPIPGGRGHNGGRIAFGPDGMLYVTVGDTRDLNSPQSLESLAGKILRMTPEGTIPSDNPFPNSLVYSYGHRNPQGLAWDDAGQLWATEFGDDTWDELNRVEAGGNFGWPIYEGRGNDSNYIDPVAQWPTQEMGPSGLAFLNGTFFIAGLTSQRLWTVTIDEAGRAVSNDYFTGQYGRIRDVFRGNDGALWFVTNSSVGRGHQVMSVPLAPL